MAAHWKKLGVTFDSIYSGFLLSPEQGKIVSEVIEGFRTSDTLVLVDPVMGDDGALYSTCTEEMKDEMIALCKSADLITPNLTEACILTHTEYPTERFSSEDDARMFSESLLHRLFELCKRIAITGIEYDCGGDRFVMTACADNGEVRFFSQKKIGTSYPGTGELFASVLLGLMLDGKEFFSSVEFSGRFVSDTITASDGVIEETRQGTALENVLGKLNEIIK